MYARALMVLLLALACAVHSSAQRSTTTLGSGPGIFSQARGSILEVHVVTQQNGPVQQIIQVVLEDGAGKQAAEAFTNQEGVAMFQGVRPGNYRLRIEGAGIIAAKTDTISIYRGDGTHLEYVRVSTKNPGGPPGGNVSATDLQVPDKARKEMDMGVEAIAKSDLALATEHLEKAIEIYPQYARAWNNLGVVRMRVGDKQGARAAWEQAIAADDKLSVAYLNLARLAISEKRPVDAEELLRKGLVTEPDDPSALLLMSTANAMRGDWADALANARRVRTESDPKKFAEAHRIAGEALTELGQPEDALVEYEAYLRDYPDSPQADHIHQQIATAQKMVQAKTTNH